LQVLNNQKKKKKVTVFEQMGGEMQWENTGISCLSGSRPGDTFSKKIRKKREKNKGKIPELIGKGRRLFGKGKKVFLL